MTDLKDKLLPDLKDAPMTEPPKKWRNLWCVAVDNSVPWRCSGCGARTKVRYKGELYFGHCSPSYPSRDIALTAAQGRSPEHRRASKYIGPVAVKE